MAVDEELEDGRGRIFAIGIEGVIGLEQTPRELHLRSTRGGVAAAAGARVLDGWGGDRRAVAAGDELKSLRVLPLLFHTISVSDGIAMGTEGMRASLPSRDWIADSVELVVLAERMDGLLTIAGCDKTLPAMMLAMIRLDLPSVFAYGGSIRPGRGQERRNSIDIGQIHQGAVREVVFPGHIEVIEFTHFLLRGLRRRVPVFNNALRLSSVTRTDAPI